MFGFILDYLVNVIVLCVAIPVTEKIFDCQIRGFDDIGGYCGGSGSCDVFLPLLCPRF